MSWTARQCLQCPDVLKNICEQAYEGGYDPDCRATVGALNATCRAFHRVASKVLWSRIFSLRPLVQCMPADVWVEEVLDVTDGRSAIAVTRPPDPSDWERFIANAAFVTSFKRHGLDPDLDDDTWCTLCLYRHGPAPFLPNLRELVWEEPDADVFEYGYQLLGPKLTTLHIGQPPSDSLLLPFLRSLHVRCPRLRHLSVQCRSAIGPSDPVVSRAISQLQHLETIDLTLPLYDDALVHLATLPNLSVAKIFLPRNTELPARLQSVSKPIFPTLSVLHVSVIRLESALAALVDHISSAQLCEVRLCAAHDPLSTTIREFLTSLGRSPSRDCLSSVHLSFPLPSSIPLMRSLSAVPPLDHPECTLDITAFQPLFACPDLTELDVTSFFLRLDDTFVRTLAAGCPRLQSLRLASPYYAGRLSEVTLGGLLPLFHHCPDLDTLSLPLNASLPIPSASTSTPSPAPPTSPPPASSPSRLRPSLPSPGADVFGSQLTTLDVGDSPIHAPDEVAAFLSAHCGTHPAFAVVAADAGDGDAAPEHVRARELHSGLWAQAARLVGLFARVRAEERERWSSGSRSGSQRSCSGAGPSPSVQTEMPD
ncbi:hypothetical protein C8Q80DRAFT_5724 [Daedaleopsis nitida]|nr:hypothetical protein C8Q80DRAFT_5724 [Daedaleopsis nitida]